MFCLFCQKITFLETKGVKIRQKQKLAYKEAIFFLILHWLFFCFYVLLVPLEYKTTIPSHSTYVIVICFVLFKKREGLQHNSFAFLSVLGRLNKLWCNILCPPVKISLCNSLNKTMTYEEWGDMVRIYSSGTKTT